jgi:hypothetical protein
MKKNTPFLGLAEHRFHQKGVLANMLEKNHIRNLQIAQSIEYHREHDSNLAFDSRTRKSNSNKKKTKNANITSAC